MDIDYENENWFFERSSTVISAKTDSEKKPKKILICELQKLNRTNPLLAKMDSNKVIYLPKNSKISLGNNLDNLIEIETDNIKIKISITYITSVNLSNSPGKTADKFREKLGLPLDESYSINFYGSTLSYEIQPKRIKRWSPKTLKELEWAEDNFKHIKELICWEKFKTNSE